MSRIEDSLEKAVKLRTVPPPVIRKEPLPPDFSRSYYEPAEKQAHLRDYLEILIRRKWIILAFLIAVVITGTVATFIMKPLYKATTTIQLRSGKTEIVTFKDVYKELNDLETQYNILSSTNLAERVATKLNLTNITEEGRKYSVGKISQGLEVEPIKKTELVTVSFISNNPEVAAIVANTVADEYINFRQESKLKPAQLGGQRLRKEVEDARERLESSEKELNEYVAKSEFVFTKNDLDYENLLAQKYASLDKELNQVTAERISKEAIYQEVKKSGIDYNVVLEKPIIQALMKDYIKLESEYSNLLIIHKPEYPKMLQLKDQIESIKKRIEIEEQTIINTLQSDYQLALKKEKLLSSAIVKLRQDVTELQKDMIQFQILKREVETNRVMYDSLLQRLKEVDISTTLTESDVQVLDKAQIPRSPFKPQKAYNIGLSLLFGLFGGIFLAFFVEYFDNTIKTDADIEKISHIPVIGNVPISKTSVKKLINDSSNDGNAFSEAFKSIRTSIQFSNTSRFPKPLLITSPVSQEGKSTISASIAKSLASLQKKGIIVDADLRRPNIHLLFELDNSTGLSTYLEGSTEFNGLIKKSQYPGLDIVTAGPIHQNPSELLNSSRIKELIDVLSAAYDYIIIDSAPILGMSDSLILSTISEGVILVIKANATPADALIQSNKALANVTANTVGIILNQVDFKSGYAYSSYYGSPYLNNDGRGKKTV
ncbi:polysaccharide biosynthesis tyrosine autokinase [candidate division WS5 bacterium]|uniref:non-specific protein-tyrosine kinase n=1 Tax=candidate division WS5 bacterium TaxID=2093353 RepID=A0A419DFD6_9BACT|nr:MAG: polysaccharide biosynthesis tyrosine autokinase [candidate division WS5 bacterium]